MDRAAFLAEYGAVSEAQLVLRMMAGAVMCCQGVKRAAIIAPWPRQLTDLHAQSVQQ